MSFTVRRLREEKARRRFPWRRVAIVSLAITRPILGFYRSWKRRSEEEARVTLLKRILLVLVSAFLALLLLGGLLKAFTALRIVSINTVFSVSGIPPPRDGHGFVNVLLIGQGDTTHDGKDLTDSIIVASLDPKTKSAVLLSLPRDLYFLHTEKMEKGRINSLYRDYKNALRFREGMDEAEAALEAVRELKEEVGRALGLQIQHVVKVDFVAFEQAVDALSGVDITVQERIEDFEYPDESYGFEPFILEAGLQHLDGKTALKYARSRHTSSDFDRSHRQQQLLTALGEKAREELSPALITRLMQILKEHVVTTMSLREMIGLLDIGKDIDRERVIALQLHDRNGLYEAPVEPGGFLYAPPRDLFEGASVLLPVSIPEFPVTWKQIQALTELLFVRRELALETPTIAVLNAGAPTGTARKFANDLTRYGFDVRVIANASTGKQDSSVITGEGEAAAFLMKLLGIPKAGTPSALTSEERRDITILLGREYRFTPLQDLLIPSLQPSS